MRRLKQYFKYLDDGVYHIHVKNSAPVDRSLEFNNFAKI